jgi:ribonuclease E
MPHRQMLINYVPGEECRVAVVEDGKLEELHAERTSAISRVGNIYVGKVTNVEPAIQAAFVDFGIGVSGFLHVTDLHPRYFPGAEDDTAERVGKKTPRRSRPPIQECLRRGDEVLVQVLKEGVGTKGPALTAYLSIPGRYLVMMPQMDHVGVSRKVEDEEIRRKMRDVLDQLELPEGFGFIVRTAGLDRNKTELKRDLAYLQRLWKDMERRLKTGSKPRLLYSESDLLVRALRDILTADTNEVIIDSELALNRASRFMKIVAPRSQIKLLHYTGKAPVFHAFGIEPQIANINAREVPLPGGGRLVIDQTEALVAIDVNSGKMRDSRDAETNAFRTNVEAVEEICRQLRLRDLGGIVINDLIDMRHASHRKEIEKLFGDRLKRDRARTTVIPISEFGILEMTRQRMRGSHESVHFNPCPTCRGRGLVQKPESIAAEAIRELASLLDHEKVFRIEMAVSPRVAGELLSSRRRSISRLERTSGKHVDVRVSEAVPIDRVSFYAYDETGADIDLPALGQLKRKPEVKPWEDTTPKSDWSEGMEDEAAQLEAQEAQAEQAAEEVVTDMAPHPIELDGENLEPAEAGAAAGPGGAPGALLGPVGGGRRRRRRGRGGRGGEGGGRGGAGGGAEGAAPAQPGQRQPPRGDRPAEQQHRRDEQRAGTGGRGGGGGAGRGQPQSQASAEDSGAGTDSHAPGVPAADGSAAEPLPVEIGPDGQPIRRKRRRRRRRRGGGGGQNGELAAAPGAPGEFSPQNIRAQEPGSHGVSMTAEGDGAPGPVRESTGDPGVEAGQRQEAPAGAGAPGLLGTPAVHMAEDDSEEHGPGQDDGAPEGASAGGANEENGFNEDGSPRKRRRRRRRRRRGGGGEGATQAEGEAGEPNIPLTEPTAESAPPARPVQPPPRREQRPPQPQGPRNPPPQHSGGRSSGPQAGGPRPEGRPQRRPQPEPMERPPAPVAAPTPAAPAAKPQPRLLYSSRRKLSPSERAKGAPRD